MYKTSIFQSEKPLYLPRLHKLSLWECPVFPIDIKLWQDATWYYILIIVSHKLIILVIIKSENYCDMEL